MAIFEERVEIVSRDYFAAGDVNRARSSASINIHPANSILAGPGELLIENLHSQRIETI